MIYVDNETGESFASMRGYARMSGLSPSAVHKRLENPVHFSDAKYAEVLTTQGLRTVRLVTEKQIVAWLPDVLERWFEGG